MLNVVKGAFDVSSTGDVSKSCDTLKKLAPSTQGGDGSIAGTFTCTSNNDKANDDTDSTTDGTGSSSGSSDTGKNSAAGVTFNVALLGLVGVAALASAL